jgi:hypothetical protein
MYQAPLVSNHSLLCLHELGDHFRHTADAGTLPKVKSLEKKGSSVALEQRYQQYVNSIRLDRPGNYVAAFNGTADMTTQAADAINNVLCKA